MGYFDEVYLKRINRYGNNIQERIQNKREHDFLTMMEKSPNQVQVLELDKYNPILDIQSLIETDSYKGVLQTNKYDEDEVQDYLLVPCDRDIAMGNLLYMSDVRHGLRKFPFLAYALDPYTTAGYNRYTVVELEEMLTWVVDGVFYSSPVHAAGGGSGARDKNINLKFRTQFSEAGVFLPNKRYSLIMPYNENIKKNHRVSLGGETWRITGFDKISVKGVMYITLEESLTDKQDDRPVANTNEFANWTFTTNQGLNFDLGTELNWENHAIYAYYKEEQTNDISLVLVPDEHLSITDVDLNSYFPGQLFSLNKKDKQYSGEAKINLYFAGSEEIIGTIPVHCVNRVVGDSKTAILGSDDIYMENEAIYTVPLANAAAIENAYIPEEDLLYGEIIEKDTEHKTITIKGKEMGEITLYVPLNSSNTISKVISIRSIWLGGKDNGNTKLI